MNPFRRMPCSSRTIRAAHSTCWIQLLSNLTRPLVDVSWTVNSPPWTSKSNVFRSRLSSWKHFCSSYRPSSTSVDDTHPVHLLRARLSKSCLKQLRKPQLARFVFKNRYLSLNLALPSDVCVSKDPGQEDHPQYKHETTFVALFWEEEGGVYEIGRRRINVLPRPGPALVALTWPPCNSTSLRTSARPTPRPWLPRLASGRTW